MEAMFDLHTLPYPTNCTVNT